jgi:hypothetical protein
MGDITAGRTWASGETATAARLNDTVNNATINASAVTTAALADGAVTTGKLADTAVTTAKITDANVTAAKLASNSVTAAKVAGDAIHGQTLVTTLADADECLFYKSVDGSLMRISKSSLVSLFQPAGAVIQTVQASPYTSNTDITAVIGTGTLPTTSNGVQILTASITPNSSSNKVLAIFNGWGTSSYYSVVASLFRGSTLVNYQQQTSQGNLSFAFNMAILDAPASTSAQTYSVRIGVAGTGGTNLRFNGSATGTLYGGAASAATLILQEIKG